VRVWEARGLRGAGSDRKGKGSREATGLPTQPPPRRKLLKQRKRARPARRSAPLRRSLGSQPHAHLGCVKVFLVRRRRPRLWLRRRGCCPRGARASSAGSRASTSRAGARRRTPLLRASGSASARATGRRALLASRSRRRRCGGCGAGHAAGALLLAPLADLNDPLLNGSWRGVVGGGGWGWGWGHVRLGANAPAPTLPLSPRARARAAHAPRPHPQTGGAPHP
jgi:hypothetical protein